MIFFTKWNLEGKPLLVTTGCVCYALIMLCYMCIWMQTLLQQPYRAEVVCIDFSTDLNYFGYFMHLWWPLLMRLRFKTVLFKSFNQLPSSYFYVDSKVKHLSSSDIIKKSKNKSHYGLALGDFVKDNLTFFLFFV